MSLQPVAQRQAILYLFKQGKAPFNFDVLNLNEAARNLRRTHPADLSEVSGTAIYNAIADDTNVISVRFNRLGRDRRGVITRNHADYLTADEQFSALMASQGQDEFGQPVNERL